ncbi:hypothetical protein [Microbacterium dauci]|uniref:HTH cro/C1-type domain-containing protein n=1 Tax=Microbacterium dauci TaxID=3048008 RepID=A0ABT6ZB84_9MICO|nr:hypothetical protein [Microbacterium sp. LX3-4]MDJ1113203.1 hypothetical protein [Microbacterium sp. LX3-4]
MATLTIDSKRFQELRDEHGLDTVQSLASALHVDKGTASRVLTGKAAPGPRFISSVLLTFPVKFEDVFTVVGEDDANAAGEAVVTDELAVAS